MRSGNKRIVKFSIIVVPHDSNKKVGFNFKVLILYDFMKINASGKLVEGSPNRLFFSK